MNFILHITTGCNMRCDYCYSLSEKRADMSNEVAHKAVDYAAELSPKNARIVFFGGEPLLRKNLLRSVIEHCEEHNKKLGPVYRYRVTTNGILLDEEFLEFASVYQLEVALSFDGIKQAHDRHRKTSEGLGTFDQLQKKINLLRHYQPSAGALMVVTPQTVRHYAKSVNFLLKKGFRDLRASLDLISSWDNDDLRELKKQYQLLSKLYEKYCLAQEKFFFGPFERKLATHVRLNPHPQCDHCHFAKELVSIAPDGKIFPCVQFVGLPNADYSIGDVWNGIDDRKRTRLSRANSKEKQCCQECVLKAKCNNSCGCYNWRTTGALTAVSPVLCETEKILIPIVDRLGDRLYRKRALLPIQTRKQEMDKLHALEMQDHI